MNDLVQREENPTTTIIQVRHENELSLREEKQSPCAVPALLQRLLVPALGERRCWGEAPVCEGPGILTVEGNGRFVVLRLLRLLQVQ